MTSDDIKQLITELLLKMNLPAETIEVVDEGGRERFCVSSRDSHLLIGARGAHLFALNHLVKRIVAKKDKERRFSLDVNDYQGTCLEYLKTKAKIMGERARSFKTSVELEPMSSFERMVIHSFFEGEKDLATESIGFGENRRVVIKYVEEGTRH